MNSNHPLTAENISQQLFSNSKYPRANGSILNLLYGVELEFIIHQINNEDKLLLKEDSRKIFQLLVSKFKYRYFVPEDLDTISIDTSLGFISIKPDFAYNIFEIAFPPRANFSALGEMLHQTFEQIDECIKVFGYQRADFSIVRKKNTPFELVGLERHEKWLKTFENISPNINISAQFTPHYPALIAATQVHLNILDKHNFFKLLPHLYSLEWLITPIFSKSTRFENRNFTCARFNLLEDTLGTAYPLKAIPIKIPDSIETYASSFETTKNFFPKESGLQGKDYSFIRPRGFGTVEFRSTCSQTQVAEILSICAFRAAQSQYALEYVDDKAGPLARSALLESLQLVESSSEIQDFKLATREKFLKTIEKLPQHISDIVIGKIQKFQ